MISTEKVHDILESMYPMRKEMVPCFIGAPGIGKTQGIYQFAEEHGAKVVTFILSNTVPSEVSGIRMPDNETKKMEVFDDMRMAGLEDGDILFFDEILEAPPMLWSACLTLIQDRIMASGRKLPDVFIVAASNPVASAGVIPASVRNRFQWIQLEFDAAAWRNWFESEFGVRPSVDLCNRIRSDSSQYNILTPRELTRLYKWCKGPGDTDIKRRCIEDWYDLPTAEAIIDLANSKGSMKQQLFNALNENDYEIPDGFKDMSFADILLSLKQLDNWDEISDTLSKIEFER